MDCFAKLIPEIKPFGDPTDPANVVDFTESKILKRRRTQLGGLGGLNPSLSSHKNYFYSFPEKKLKM